MSMFAGMAFTNALVHVGHSIGHTLGAQFDIPHGIACVLLYLRLLNTRLKQNTKSGHDM